MSSVASPHVSVMFCVNLAQPLKETLTCCTEDSVMLLVVAFLASLHHELELTL